MHVQINCKDHGEVQATVNQNGDAFCPDCYREKVQESLVVDESVAAPSPLLTEQEKVVHTMLFRQKIMAGLGVSEAMMNGPTTYATSSISARMAEASKMITGQVTRDEYIKANLADEMRKHRGKKRLRKKKAKRALRMRWGFLQMGRILSRRINYSEIGRKMFTVEPMPDPVMPIYMRDIDILDAVTGGEE